MENKKSGHGELNIDQDLGRVSIQTGVASSNARQRTPASCLRALITTVAGEIVHTSRIVRGVFVEIARGAFALLGSSWSMADAEAGLDDGPPLRQTLHRPKAEYETSIHIGNGLTIDRRSSQLDRSAPERQDPLRRLRKIGNGL